MKQSLLSVTEFLIGILFLGITEINAPSSVNTNFLPNISVKRAPRTIILLLWKE